MNTTKTVLMQHTANFALLAVTFVWGATFTLTKDALSHVPVFPFLAVRFWIASLLLVWLVVATHKHHSMTWRSVWLGTLLGTLLFGAYALQTIGLESTSPSTAGFLTGLSVVLVPILGLPLLNSRPGKRNWYGAGLAIIGLACLCGVDLLHLAVGDLLVLLCAVFIAGQMIMIEKYGRETDALVLATVEIVVLALLCTVFCGVESRNLPRMSVWFRRDVLWAVFICAIPGTALAYWAQNVFQKFTSSAQTALIFSTEPVFAALVAWLALGEVLTNVELIGCLLIFASMLVADPSIRIRGRRALQ